MAEMTGEFGVPLRPDHYQMSDADLWPSPSSSPNSSLLQNSLVSTLPSLPTADGIIQSCPKE